MKKKSNNFVILYFQSFFSEWPIPPPGFEITKSFSIQPISQTKKTKNTIGIPTKYGCPYCTFNYKRKDHVYRHIRIKHPNQPIGFIDLTHEMEALLP